MSRQPVGRVALASRQLGVAFGTDTLHPRLRLYEQLACVQDGCMSAAGICTYEQIAGHVVEPHQTFEQNSCHLRLAHLAEFI